jgi:hypothetical protein
MTIGMNNVTNFELKKVTIKTYESLPQAIGEMHIFEGIDSPGITGTITLMDWQGFDELGEVFAGDDLLIEFMSGGRDSLVLKYKIYAATGASLATATYQPITYHFCSPWMIDAYTRQISKSYKDKFIHEIVHDLLTECGADIGFIEPTKQKLPRFTTPLWTAIKSMTHLLSFAINQTDVGGYVLWTDMKTGKVNATTVDYLYKGTYGIEESRFVSLPKNEFYEARIDSLTFESCFDIIRHLNQGTAQTIYQGYFYDKNKLYTSDKGVNKNPYTHLSAKLPINASYNTPKYASIKKCYLYPSKDDLISDDKMYTDIVDGAQRTRYVRLFSDVFKINISTNPNSSRRAGHLVELVYPSVNKGTPSVNLHYAGMYLIRNIRHVVTHGIYNQYITVVSDGYVQSGNDLIEW